MKILEVRDNADAAQLGAQREVSASVSLGALVPADVTVQLLHGRVGQGDELIDPVIVSMGFSDEGSYDDHLTYVGSFAYDEAGRYGFTVRVVPANTDLVSAMDLGRIAWA